MAQRVRRRQDDDRAARPPDPPLRHRRDRQRQLALQKPRCRSRNPRSPRLRNPGQLRRGERYRQNPPLKGVKIGRRCGVKFERRLTLMEGSIARSAMLKLFDINIEAAEPGLVVLTAIPTAEHYNPLGFVHGGYAAVLLDTCMAAAIVTSLEPGLSPVTLEYKISFTRPMSADTGVVRGEGKTLHVGRQTAIAKADCSTRTAGFSPTGRPPAMSCGKEFPEGSLPGASVPPAVQT